jgi:hypothetical protein
METRFWTSISFISFRPLRTASLKLQLYSTGLRLWMNLIAKYLPETSCMRLSKLSRSVLLMMPPSFFRGFPSWSSTLLESYKRSVLPGGFSSCRMTPFSSCFMIPSISSSQKNPCQTLELTTFKKFSKPTSKQLTPEFISSWTTWSSKIKISGTPSSI